MAERAVLHPLSDGAVQRVTPCFGGTEQRKRAVSPPWPQIRGVELERLAVDVFSLSQIRKVLALRKFWLRQQEPQFLLCAKEVAW